MTNISISRATPADAARLNTALRALSQSMGDAHNTTDDQIARALAPGGAIAALIAEQGAQVVGAAVFSPLFSTTRGMAGAYVSDLWVAEGLRGAGLGPRLLAAVHDAAAQDWGAGFLRLGVYAHNARARAFYDRLGFTHAPDEHYLTLSGHSLAALKGKP
ncbi:MAG: GNAT family N-acetyltransferase [Pararhodobacter sp.]|nr:GNAT family N-acetyltransferase [Pararhodobacter sp.]